MTFQHKHKTIHAHTFIIIAIVSQVSAYGRLPGIKKLHGSCYIDWYVGAYLGMGTCPGILRYYMSLLPVQCIVKIIEIA